MNKKKEQALLSLTKLNYGNIIFTIGIAIILIAGFIDFEQSVIKIIMGTLMILGIVIGLVNITKYETKRFLLAGIATIVIMGPFVVVQSQNFIFSMSIFSYLTQILIQNNSFSNVIMNMANYFLAFITPATIIVAIKTFFQTAKD